MLRIKKNKYIRKFVTIAILACTLTGIMSYNKLTNIEVYAASNNITDSSFKSIYNKRYENIYSEYDKYSTPINQSQTSDGIKITIKNAVFDGKMTSFTYEIESNRDLGDSFSFSNKLEDKKIKSNTDNKIGDIGFSKIRRISGNKYAGAAECIQNKDANTIDISINLNGIGHYNYVKNSDDVISKGKWNFNVKLDALESKEYYINKSINKGNVKFTIDKIKRTPISCYIEGKEEFGNMLGLHVYDGDTQLLVKDDLGNIYEDIQGEGSSKGINVSSKINIYGKINDNARKLIITPTMNILETTSSTNGTVKMDDYNYEDYIIQKNELESIVVELD